MADGFTDLEEKIMVVLVKERKTASHTIADAHELAGLLDAEKDKLDVQLGEARTALEIASPSMVHTFSGHVYEDGNPVEWVDGCGKCRVMKILSKTEKR